MTKKFFHLNLSTFGETVCPVTLNALPKLKVEIIIQGHVYSSNRQTDIGTEMTYKLSQILPKCVIHKT